MKKNLLPLIATVLFATMINTSCKKSDSTTSPEISFAINTDNSVSTTSNAVNATNALSAITIGTANVTVTSGVANIAAFKLEAKKNNVKTEITTTNLMNVDLFALGQSLGSTKIDTGTYKEIEVKVLLVKSATTALPLVLKGYFTTKAGTQVPLEFDFNDNAILKAEASNVHVDGTKDLVTTVNLHVNKLFGNITSAEVDQTTRTNGTILISSTVNAALYNKILANVATWVGCKGFEMRARSGR